MSDAEDDIWSYKSVRKQKAPGRTAGEAASQEQARTPGTPTRRRHRRKTTGKRKDAAALPSQHKPANHGPNAQTTPTRKQNESQSNPSPKTPAARPSGHCPSCQMPFSILLVQTPRWHVSECLDTPVATHTECPEGITCSSTIASHYKRFSHVLLAHSRAADHSPPPPLRSQDRPSSCAVQSQTTNGFTQENDKNRHNSSSASISSSEKPKPCKSRSPASSQTSLEAWLSSPAKGAKNSPSSSQEVAGRCSPPCATSQRLSQQDADCKDGAVSYSPLVSDQELFSEEEEDRSPGGALHGSGVSLGNGLPDMRTPQRQRLGVQGLRAGGNDPAPEAQSDWSVCSTPVSEACGWALSQLLNADPDNAPLASSARAEGRSALSGHTDPDNAPPASSARAEGRSALTGHTGPDNAPPASSAQAAGSSLCAGIREGGRSALTGNTDPAPGSQSPSHSQAMSSRAMKQTDIGVFFGLKPKAKVLEKAEVKAPLRSQSPNAVAEKPSRKRKALGSLGEAGALAGNASQGSAAGGGTQKRWGKRYRENATAEEGKGRKQCPFYKKIPGTGFTVDAFQYGAIEGCTAYFLTHFHSDHYGGLTKKFRSPIYCSQITGNLVESKLRVEKPFINVLPMDTECIVGNVKVVLLDANHCPGAVLLLFILPGGSAVLHTGDFRAEPSMERYPALIGQKIHTLYLDTTYCSPEYTFPPQQEAVQFAVNAAFEAVALNPRTLLVCGTYSVGKERVFLAIAGVLGCAVAMSPDKYKTMQCLESEEIRSMVTTDWRSTALHVLPMMQVNFKGLAIHLSKFSGKYDRVLAFKPTGWTYSDGCSSVADIRPDVRGKVAIYGVPYSEHSSFLEMKRFVQFIKPQKIIPTVNMGSPKSRAAMDKHFADWLSGARR